MFKEYINCEVDGYGFPHWNGFDFFRWYVLPTNWNFMTGKNKTICL